MGPTTYYSQSEVIIHAYQFKSVAPRVFLAKIPFLVSSHYHDNHFPDFFSPCFKLGQNLSSCQVLEKCTYRFGWNDGTDRQSTFPYIYIYIYI